jgi:uncharacterized protein with GYD domain
MPSTCSPGRCARSEASSRTSGTRSRTNATGPRRRTDSTDDVVATRLEELKDSYLAASAHGTARRDALGKAISGLGGTMEALSFAFGDDDVIVVCDLPDNAAVASLWLAVGGAGGVKDLSTTVLLTPEDIDEAAKRHPDYRPPGS